MSWPAKEQLHELSKAELIELLGQLLDRVAHLEAEVERLKRPPTNSQNSSQPPSRDQKANLVPPRRKKRRGARPGHAKMERPLVEQPDRLLIARVERCVCGVDLGQVEPLSVTRRQVTELPVVRPLVIETQQYRVRCPGCGQVQEGELPQGLEAGRNFGPRLEATVAYLHQQQHLSYERLRQTLHELFGVELSEGGQASIMRRAGVAAQAQAEQLRLQIQQSEVVGSDETSARVSGCNWWEWVFRSAQTVYHVIRPSRGTDVIEQVLGAAQVGTWVSDCWKPQLRAPAAQRQLCLAHQIRNLQGLIERCPRLKWAHQLQSLLREAIHLRKRREQLTESGFARRVREIEERLHRLVARPVKTPAAQALVKRYRKHRENLLVFLHDLTVPHHNNDCERSLRSSVVHRKVSGGFRSEWGAAAYAALASVLGTAKLRAQSVFATLVKLMGHPILPYFVSQDP
jgi:transposase